MTVLPQLQTADSTQALPHLRRSQARTIGIASIIWAASIFLSRIMGLLREQIIGRTLGASREADLYFASFTLPDFLNYLLAAGALSIVFIPIFVEYLERNDRDGGWKALSVIANFLLVVGTIGIAQKWVGLKVDFAGPNPHLKPLVEFTVFLHSPRADQKFVAQFFKKTIANRSAPVLRSSRIRSPTGTAYFTSAMNTLPGNFAEFIILGP